MDKITYAQLLLLIALIVFGIILVVIRAQGNCKRKVLKFNYKNFVMSCLCFI